MALPRIEVSELRPGDLVRGKHWNRVRQEAEEVWNVVERITPGPTSSWIELSDPDGGNAGRIRPRNDKRIVARRPS